MRNMLTPREIEVLEHLSNGGSNQKIALDLHICERTVKNHCKNIYHKVGVPSWANNRVWIVIHAAETLEKCYTQKELTL